ncbi:MAG: hypothetical protein AABX39_02565, partial [Nanoarchaeota archaeon]
MITAKLMKSLENEGFALEFPSYESNEERIAEIIKENDERLFLALPLLLRHEFNYEKIKKICSKDSLQKFNKILTIVNKIFAKEKIEGIYLKDIIKKYQIKQEISKEEFNYYHGSFLDFTKNREKENEDLLIKQIRLRGNLNLNQAISKIYSPGKMRIMDKIFNHETLTNTELKYYYKSIRPLILAILNENMQKYLRIIESVKKLS